MKTKEREAKEVQHYYAGQKKGYWWKYLLAALIVFIYLILCMCWYFNLSKESPTLQRSGAAGSLPGGKLYGYSERRLHFPGI